ncbi:MAG TPA: serine O-acetyltransferase [Cellvibrionaceae bacterium]|nr:serine O-acetyltransferase [Cellvibrionaceae bacterium]HMY38073.1 serine O-acetyltransferase [Marinagarivorans sp.]
MHPGHDPIWSAILAETRQEAQREPALASFLHATILNHATFEAALSFHLANKLGSTALSSLLVRELIEQALHQDASIGNAARADIQAVFERDSACEAYSLPFLYFKGFHALQAYRVAHWLWKQGRKSLAYYFQSHISLCFGVDIHPAARLGKGLMLDHGTGIVIGETSVVDDDVSIMQAVTLGGTGKESGDRHPKVGKGVLISAGAKILGNITVGEGAKIGAGSVVLKPVAAHTTVAGVPAVVVGAPTTQSPAKDMIHEISCDELCAQLKQQAAKN